jgi:hypothetical protein
MNAILEQIKPETIALIETQATHLGLSIDEYLRRLLPTGEQELALKGDSNQAEFEADMIEFAEGTDDLPAHNGTYSREDIYAEETVEDVEAKRQKSIAWIKSHRDQYGGKYVALDGDKVIGIGDRYGDALKLALKAGYKNAFIGNVLPLDFEGYLGGFD